jgi:hypothetical protein
MPCTPPHRSWKSAAVANQRGRPFLRFRSPSAHAWAVPYAQWFPGHRVTRVSRLALGGRVSARHGFFRPPRASCATCRVCFIPAAPLGFSLQRSVRIASRTPLGSPCPSFLWPRVAPFGFPSADRRVSDIPGSRRSSDGSGQLRSLPGRALTRPLRAGNVDSRTHRFLCRSGSQTSTTMSLPSCRNSRVEACDARVFPRLPEGRLSGSHLSWAFCPPGLDGTCLGLDFASPPLSFLVVPRRPYRNLRVSIGRCRNIRSQ